MFEKIAWTAVWLDLLGDRGCVGSETTSPAFAEQNRPISFELRILQFSPDDSPRRNGFGPWSFAAGGPGPGVSEYSYPHHQRTRILPTNDSRSNGASSARVNKAF